MEPFWTEHFLLPHQGHRGCQAVADALERAREQVAEMVGSEAYEIVFTGGATEANNLAIRGTTLQYPNGHIIVSQLEHDSVWHTAIGLREAGWTVDLVHPDQHGVLAVETIEDLLRPDTRLVCLQAVNAVLGTFQPVREVADICHSRGIPVHCDMSQVFGKSPLRVQDLRADTAAISGHKLYGPKGVGALYVRRGLQLFPVSSGESGEMGLRPGSENVPGWIGLGAAARLASRASVEATSRLQELRDRFLTQISEQLDGRVHLVCGENPNRLANTALIRLPGDANKIVRMARQLVLALPRSAAPADEITRCLRAVGASDREIASCCRVSVGLTTSQEQIDRAADLLAEACEIVCPL